MYKGIHQFISALDSSAISEQRKQVLQPMINYLVKKHNANQAIALNFICTHNSRRSHFAQIWATTIANYYGLNGIRYYSSGTEATAVYKSVIESLQNIGFHIQQEDSTSNPQYFISFTEEEENPIIAYSKTIESVQPKIPFAAIMTCSQAAENCPFVPGAEIRVAIPYEDPKVSDGSAQELEHYQQKSKEIATEMNYVFATLKQQIHE